MKYILSLFILVGFCGCKTSTQDANLPAFKGFNKNLGVPNNVISLARYIKENDQTYPNYVGGRRFGNFEKRLPKTYNGQKIQYKEWDVHPKIKGKNRGAERLVSDQFGKIYYTKDHYKTFIELLL